MNNLMISLRWIREKLAQGIKFAFANVRITLELLLVLALVLAGWAYNRKVAQLQAATAQFGQLSADLKHQITVKDNQIQILNRKPNGKVEVHTVYVPGEGTVTVVYSTQPAPGAIHNPPPGHPIDLGDGTIVYVKDKGTCFKPGFGFDYDGWKPRAYVDAKLFFYKRYGAGVGGSTGGLGIMASRHLDDVLFFHPENVELFFSYRVLRIGNGNTCSIGLRSNF